MTIKQQLYRIKENWIITLVLIILVLFLTNSSPVSLTKGGFSGVAMESSFAPRGIYQEDFSPEIQERIITKSANLQTEIKRGTFKEKEKILKEIIKDSYLLNENINTREKRLKEYINAYYQIKVKTEDYNEIITKLKEIGKVKSFNENLQDITKRYTNIKTELELERTRLQRYQEMYAKADKISDKIELNDRIFNQERTIKYLEDSLENLDNRVDYSTISFSMNEKQSEYANIAFIKISEIAKSFMASINFLVKLIFIVLPWVILIGIIFLVKRKFWK